MFAPLPHGVRGAVVPLDTRVDGCVQLRPEVCCPLVPCGAGGTVVSLDACVDGASRSLLSSLLSAIQLHLQRGNGI